MTEEWREVNGYNGKYQVSNIGRIKNTKSRCKQDEPNIMKPFASFKPQTFYFRIALTDNKGVSVKHQVHRLVADAFIPNPENKPFINHINCLGYDNRVENLEWCTAKENHAHSQKLGRLNTPRGEQQVNSKLTNDQVIQIKKLLKEGKLSQYRIAKNFGVHKVTIFDIKYGNTWTHL